MLVRGEVRCRYGPTQNRFEKPASGSIEHGWVGDSAFRHPLVVSSVVETDQILTATTPCSTFLEDRCDRRGSDRLVGRYVRLEVLDREYRMQTT